MNSCAYSPNKSGIHPEFEDYTRDFEKIVPEYAQDIRRLNIRFENFSKNGKDYNVIGRCYYNRPLSENTIGIDRRYWGFATPTNKQFTLLHELGHCVCYAPHSEPTSGWLGKIENILFKLGIRKRKGYLDDGCPASIMHPTEFSDLCAVRHYFYYINELRQTCRDRK